MDATSGPVTTITPASDGWSLVSSEPFGRGWTWAELSPSRRATAWALDSNPGE